jgi:hypothetical protein
MPHKLVVSTCLAAIVLLHLITDASAWLLESSDSGALFNGSHNYLRRNDHILKLSGNDREVILSDVIGSFSFNINAPTDESKNISSGRYSPPITI